MKTTAELRHVINTTSYLAPGDSYDRAKHYDLEWVDLVMRKMYTFQVVPALSPGGLHFDYRVTLFESPDQLLLKTNLEGWYDSNVWPLVVDHCLQDLTGMRTVRYVGWSHFPAKI